MWTIGNSPGLGSTYSPGLAGVGSLSGGRGLLGRDAPGSALGPSVWVCSRIATGFALLGSAVGLGTALLVGGDGGDVYDGLWGYNAVLTAVAIRGVFYVLTWRSALLAVAAAITASVLFAALGAALLPLGLPSLTLPFCLSTFAFLLLAGASSRFEAVEATVVTTPEDHRLQWKASRT